MVPPRPLMSNRNHQRRRQRLRQIHEAPPGRSICRVYPILFNESGQANDGLLHFLQRVKGR